MKTASVTDFRKRMKEHLQDIENDQDILILLRPKQNASFVVMTMTEYESLKETAHLLSTQANTMRLMKGITEAKKGKALVRKLLFK